jgi:hypothetical protein
VHRDLEDDRRAHHQQGPVHHVGRDVRLEAGRERQQPRRGDDPEVDEDQAQVLATPGPAVHSGRHVPLGHLDSIRRGAVSHDAPSCFDLTQRSADRYLWAFPIPWRYRPVTHRLATN